ncbi:hypothetical protein ACLOJK_002916 [Asimina triloba]
MDKQTKEKGVQALVRHVDMNRDLFISLDAVPQILWSGQIERESRGEDVVVVDLPLLLSPEGKTVNLERVSSQEAVDLLLLSLPEGKIVDLERISSPEAVHLPLFSSLEGKTVDLERISSPEAIDLVTGSEDTEKGKVAGNAGERHNSDNLVEKGRAEANNEGEGEREREEKMMAEANDEGEGECESEREKKWRRWQRGERRG